jgi:hypothetical protein
VTDKAAIAPARPQVEHGFASLGDLAMELGVFLLTVAELDDDPAELDFVPVNDQLKAPETALEPADIDPVMIL